MKKTAITLAACFILALCANACIKKSVAPVVASDSIVCLVMDSTNALVGNATFTYNKNEKKTTDWSGRVVLPCQEKIKVKIEANGYKSLTQELRTDAAQPIIIRLTKAPVAAQKDKSYRGTIRTGCSARKEIYTEEVMYSVKMMDCAAPLAGAKPEVVEESAIAEMEEAPARAGGGINIAPAAGKLTAGEVNDFAKWALWSDILDKTHSQYISQWKMTARDRYTVQVVGQNRYPVVGRQVSLVSKQGTVFQAITDNMGRAELWNGLCGPAAEGPLWVAVDGKRTEIKADRFITIETEDECDAPETTDVMFVMDATGSMGDELRYMTAELQDVIARSEHAVEGVTIRTGAIVYRDHGDAYLTRISRLTEDINETQTFLNKQEANGGGDYEEAIPEALMATINAAGWADNARARIAFLIFDAPCHDDSATIAMLHEQVLNAAAMGIRLVPVVCSGLREAGELLARTLALATNGTSFFLTDDSGIGHSHLKPTTDSIKVEHLNDMMVRTIIEFTRMSTCEQEEESVESESWEHFIPNPTDAPTAQVTTFSVKPNPCTDAFEVACDAEIESLCLVDASGKLILTLGAQHAGTTRVKVGGLATGVYFAKALINGQWQTKKVIIKSI